jgi:thioredoxin reductase (NADPH)
MSYYLIEELKALPNVRVLTHTEVAEAHGESSLEAITLRSNETGEASRVPARALFIFIGATPRTECLAGKVARDEKGFILSGPDLMPNGKHPEGWPLDRDPFLLETSVPGIFVAGDVRHGSVKRVASGVGEGSIAVQMIHQYLSKLQ